MTAQTLGPSAWLALFAVVASVLVTSTTRYLPPSGDPYIGEMAPGASDLIPSFNAGAALLRGRNPYRATKHAAYADPYAFTRGEYQNISYLYPPSHAWIYVPVVWLSGYNFPVAARIHLALSLVCLFLLALAIVELLGSMVALDATSRLALIPLLALVLGLNPGSMLGFERGQSDLFTATFCWWGAVAWRRGWLASSAFLIVAGTLLKGYGLLLAIGLFALALRQGRWRASVLGALAAIALLLAPVARYLPDAVIAYRIRSAMFHSNWYNQGFSNLLYIMGLRQDSLGRYVVLSMALLAAGSAWLQLRRTERSGSEPAERALWLSAFTTAALIAVLGYSLNSLAYDCVIVMPGALLLALGQEGLVRRWPFALRLLARLGIAVALVFLFMFDLGRAVGQKNPALRMPASAVAEFAFMVLIGVAATEQLVRARVVTWLWFKLAAVLGLLALIVLGIKFGVEYSMRPPDLARDAPWRASSRALSCVASTRSCGGGRLPVFVQTVEEPDPWVELDLGATRRVAAIEVTNREDCCREKALPLILETSQDRSQWQQVARKDDIFTEWRADFTPVKARYVRARVPRLSTLHLERIGVW
jgi:hypothetical protein